MLGWDTIYFNYIANKLAICDINFFQALGWIKETGEHYLTSHSSVGESREETERLLKEHNEFKGNAKASALAMHYFEINFERAFFFFNVWLLSVKIACELSAIVYRWQAIKTLTVQTFFFLMLVLVCFIAFY